jgi:SAM-dependent methyltransferase
LHRVDPAIDLQVPCPACGNDGAQIRQSHPVEAAAEHFVPRERSPTRHDELVGHLSSLWNQDFVAIAECEACGFGFAVPWVGGDERFYALAHAGEPHYPRDRWEFGQTLAALPPSARLLEVGAGDGAFLDRLPPTFDVLAADFDVGAVDRLRAKGYPAQIGSLADIEEGDFDAVCLFQTLEHMADVDGVFRELRRLLRPHGSAFISVPNAAATAVQEELTGLWDMPPNHVARWSEPALRAAAARQAFDVIGITHEPVGTRRIAQQLAVSKVNALAYTRGGLAPRANGISNRPLRGVAKRVLALGHLPGILSRRRHFQPWTVWAHLRVGAQDRR